MEEKKELHRLCQEIKRMIPAVSLNPDATEPFTNFLKLLKGKGVSQEEIDCIHRAYNYFNQIISKVKPVPSGATGTVSNENENDANENENDQGPTGEVVAIGYVGNDEVGATGDTDGPLSMSASLTESLTESMPESLSGPTDEFKIDTLIQLFELNRQRMAAQDMKQIADSISNSTPLPDINMDWTPVPISKVNRTTLVDKINYQFELAGKIQEWMNTLESLAVYEAAYDVQQLFNRRDENATLSKKSTWNGSTWKDSQGSADRLSGGTTTGNNLSVLTQSTRGKSVSENESIEILPDNPLFIAAQRRMVEAVDQWVKSLE